MEKISKQTVLDLLSYYKSNNLIKLESASKKLLKKFPNEIFVYNMLSISLVGQKKYGKAIAVLQKALKIFPKSAEIICNIGNVFNAQKKYGKALKEYEQALSIKPGYAEVYYNIANIQKEQKKFDESSINYNKAIQIKPDYVDAYCNLGTVKKHQQKIKEAIINYKKALKINPRHKNTIINLGYLNLSNENFQDGWKAHERRVEILILYENLKLKNKIVWDGKKFQGKLLVIGEQGLGDHILFGSMLNDLSKKHSEIIVMVEERLFSLFKRSFPKISFISNKNGIKNISFEKYIFLGSLGKFFRNTSSSFPENQVSFLTPDNKNVANIKKLIKNRGIKKIGLSWMTNSLNNKKERSIPLKKFIPILKNHNFDFFDLQYGDTKKERSLVCSKTRNNIIHFNSLDYTNDIEGLAALISECDLVITIANFTTQLAGSLGVPTWVLLPHTCHWRWFLKRSDSLWYPSIRLFRQAKGGDWDTVINNINESLNKLK